MEQRTYSIESKLYTDFKAICVYNRITATSVIQQLIAKYVSDNKDGIPRQSETVKHRLTIPRLYDDNAKWIKFYSYPNTEEFLDATHRLTYLHSLSQLAFNREPLFLSSELMLHLQQNPFEKTSDYKSLKTLGLPVIGGYSKN